MIIIIKNNVSSYSYSYYYLRSLASSTSTLERTVASSLHKYIKILQISDKYRILMSDRPSRGTNENEIEQHNQQLPIIPIKYWRTLQLMIESI